MLKLGVWVQVIDPNSIFYQQVGQVQDQQTQNGRLLCKLFGFWFDATDVQLWLGMRS
jgi:hypothetical protein